MKTHPPKLKSTPRPLFSCGFFRQCTQSVVSPTSTSSPPPPVLPLPLVPQSHQPPPPSPPPPSPLSSSSNTSTTSQSFTQWQWRFPLPTTSSPISPHHNHSHQYPSPPAVLPPPPPLIPIGHQPHHHNIIQVGVGVTNPQPQVQLVVQPVVPPVLTPVDFQQLFHVAEIQLNSDSDTDRLNALHMLERSLVPNPPPACPAAVMEKVIGYLKDGGALGAKAASKVLLALCIGGEGNRRVAVELGAAGRVVEALAELEGAAAERALAALELMCTVVEGAAEVRGHALAVPMMVEVMGKMEGRRRGKEYAMSVLGVIYGPGGFGDEEEGVDVVLLAPAEEVGRAVALALQGECSDRGRRKGAQLLKMLDQQT